MLIYKKKMIIVKARSNLQKENDNSKSKKRRTLIDVLEEIIPNVKEDDIMKFTEITEEDLN